MSNDVVELVINPVKQFKRFLYQDIVKELSTKRKDLDVYAQRFQPLFLNQLVIANPSINVTTLELNAIHSHLLQIEVLLFNRHESGTTDGRPKLSPNPKINNPQSLTDFILIKSDRKSTKKTEDLRKEVEAATLLKRVELFNRVYTKSTQISCLLERIREVRAFLGNHCSDYGYISDEELFEALDTIGLNAPLESEPETEINQEQTQGSEIQTQEQTIDSNSLNIKEPLDSKKKKKKEKAKKKEIAKKKEKKNNQTLGVSNKQMLGNRIVDIEKLRLRVKSNEIEMYEMRKKQEDMLKALALLYKNAWFNMRNDAYSDLEARQGRENIANQWEESRFALIKRIIFWVIVILLIAAAIYLFLHFGWVPLLAAKAAYHAAEIAYAAGKISKIFLVSAQAVVNAALIKTVIVGIGSTVGVIFATTFFRYLLKFINRLARSKRHTGEIREIDAKWGEDAILDPRKALLNMNKNNRLYKQYGEVFDKLKSEENIETLDEMITELIISDLHLTEKDDKFGFLKRNPRTVERTIMEMAKMHPNKAIKHFFLIFNKDRDFNHRVAWLRRVLVGFVPTGDNGAMFVHLLCKQLEATEEVFFQRLENSGHDLFRALHIMPLIASPFAVNLGVQIQPLNPTIGINTSYWYRDDDVNVAVNSFIMNELGGYALGCKYKLNKAFGKHTIFVTPAVDTQGASLPIDYFLDKNVAQPDNTLAAYLSVMRKNLSELKELNSLDVEQVIKRIAMILQKELSVETDVELLYRIYQELQDVEVDFNVDMLDKRILELEEERRGDNVDVFDEMDLTSDGDFRILVPYNVTSTHWKSLEIEIHKVAHAYTVDISVHDPYGGGAIDLDNLTRLEQALLKRIRDTDKEAQVTINNKVSPYHKRQNSDDGVSCGVITSHDILERIQGKSLAREKPFSVGVPELRELYLQHAKHAIQSDVISKRDFQLFFQRNTQTIMNRQQVLAPQQLDLTNVARESCEYLVKQNVPTQVSALNWLHEYRPLDFVNAMRNFISFLFAISKGNKDPQTKVMEHLQQLCQENGWDKPVLILRDFLQAYDLFIPLGNDFKAVGAYKLYKYLKSNFKENKDKRNLEKAYRQLPIMQLHAFTEKTPLGEISAKLHEVKNIYDLQFRFRLKLMMTELLDDKDFDFSLSAIVERAWFWLNALAQINGTDNSIQQEIIDVTVDFINDALVDKYLAEDDSAWQLSEVLFTIMQPCSGLTWSVMQTLIVRVIGTDDAKKNNAIGIIQDSSWSAKHKEMVGQLVNNFTGSGKELKENLRSIAKDRLEQQFFEVFFNDKLKTPERNHGTHKFLKNVEGLLLNHGSIDGVLEHYSLQHVLQTLLRMKRGTFGGGSGDDIKAKPVACLNTFICRYMQAVLPESDLQGKLPANFQVIAQCLIAYVLEMASVLAGGAEKVTPGHCKQALYLGLRELYADSQLSQQQKANLQFIVAGLFDVDSNSNFNGQWSNYLAGQMEDISSELTEWVTVCLEYPEYALAKSESKIKKGEEELVRLKNTIFTLERELREELSKVVIRVIKKQDTQEAVINEIMDCFRERKPLDTESIANAIGAETEEIEEVLRDAQLLVDEDENNEDDEIVKGEDETIAEKMDELKRLKDEKTTLDAKIDDKIRQQITAIQTKAADFIHLRHPEWSKTIVIHLSEWMADNYMKIINSNITLRKFTGDKISNLKNFNIMVQKIFWEEKVHLLQNFGLLGKTDNETLNDEVSITNSFNKNQIMLCGIQLNLNYGLHALSKVFFVAKTNRSGEIVNDLLSAYVSIHKSSEIFPKGYIFYSVRKHFHGMHSKDRKIVAARLIAALMLKSDQSEPRHGELANLILFGLLETYVEVDRDGVRLDVLNKARNIIKAMPKEQKDSVVISTDMACKNLNHLADQSEAVKDDISSKVEVTIIQLEEQNQNKSENTTQSENLSRSNSKSSFFRPQKNEQDDNDEKQIEIEPEDGNTPLLRRWSSNLTSSSGGED